MASAIVLSGGSGFLGWHTRVLVRALGLPAPALLARRDFTEKARLAGLVDGADRVLHVAGVNRGTPQEVADGNTAAARRLADAIQRCATPPKTVVFANSTQAGNGTAYGDSKAAAAGILADATRWCGSQFVDLKLPNLFGEHGRPHYNSVVATFCRTLADGGTPRVDEDRPLDLVHVQDAAAALLGRDGADLVPVRRTVIDLKQKLAEYAAIYRKTEIPALTDPFELRLFNTYRSHCFPAHYPMPLPKHEDARGGLVEAVKTHGDGGQTFFSTTKPGITRGEHFHLSKVERFVVVRGEAEIRLRRVLHDDVTCVKVTGDVPVVVDMPTMWVHNITNVGTDDLLTLFWTNEIFDPGRPDTYPETVSP
jgi:UDP-2-acetamido-2,6-beta-L-arabino-hexul-4-ose reductase